MSTISRALQKNNAQHAAYAPNFYRKEKSNITLKAALFATSLVVICLLTTLIFLLVKPLNATQEVVIITPANVITEEPLLQVGEPEKTLDLIKKITFSLKPLPILSMESEPTQFVSAQPIAKAIQLPSTAPMPQQENTRANELKEIDYSESSADLQQRFQSALLMANEVEKDNITEENSDSDDGRDIHQMDSDFQRQLPSLQYDFHMYSSKAEDRWIRINGEDLSEGQFSHALDIEVVEIQPHRTIFRFGRQSFSLESLANWEGY